MMKRTITLGVFFMLMTFVIGMTPPRSQSSCSIACTTQCFFMCLEPSPEPHSQQDHPRDRNKVRPAKLNQKRELEHSTEAREFFGSNKPMPPNMVEHVMAVAKEIDPELAQRLGTICESDPEGFETIIRRQGRRLGSLHRLRESDPELFEVKVAELKTDAEIYHLTTRLRGKNLNDPSVQAQIVELRGHVRVKTALSLRAQKLYIERLEQHLEALRVRLVNTSSRFDAIVDDCVDQLMVAIQKDNDKEPTQTD